MPQVAGQSPNDGSTITLYPGWNNIGYLGPDRTPLELIDSISPVVTQIARWNGDVQAWDAFNVAAPTDSLDYPNHPDRRESLVILEWHPIGDLATTRHLSLHRAPHD